MLQNQIHNHVLLPGGIYPAHPQHVNPLLINIFEKNAVLNISLQTKKTNTKTSD